jgi:predicted RNase H-like HicB family nuclease
MGIDKSIIGFLIEIAVKPDSEGYHAYCPSFKGLHVDGDTEQEALQNAKDAAVAYLESLIKHGDPIPLKVVKREYKTNSQGVSHYIEKLQIPCAI